ncbi:enoyl-CoA hydratase-related protein [Mycobacterium sp. CVI_P3]|uniref:Enoyl-CoA hydratase-related protein n=1 Tax=Mycobacterium pinniadriaticum TaxID=2994102 RepID=A0ABT3SDC7_9MYCO|nr:enoyl-CoA hydratase-related protein [Mycobacterium pinniadriaticum]MCX2931274.1 enoyl-CoA hydratase-related protein [Mycobacterium pinniadriaticum]MCX2937502.1 enoyl-CoA hydratase-related protein [Mycobacterium pinniadriaticum]
MTEKQTVRYEVAAGVCTLTFNRPDRNNAWSISMEQAYYAGLDRAAVDDDVRVIIVTGEGKSFCPGLDKAILDEIRSGSTFADNRRPATVATTIPKPVIAAINGGCAGVGMVQATLCDLRFAAAGAKLSWAFSRRGLPAEDGSSWTLARLVGHGRAMDLLLSGRVFTAEEAYEMGLVQRLFEPDELLARTMDYASDLARNVSPTAMAMVKHQLWSDWDTSLENSRVRAQQLLPIAKRQPDFQEGVRSLVEKRPPEFAPYRTVYF